MWTLIIGIFLIYSATIFFLHLKYKQCEQKIILTNRVVLVIQNNQSQIEWYMRVLLFKSKLKGINLLIILIDNGSTDETIEIIERIALKYELSIKYFNSNPERIMTSLIVGEGHWNIVEINRNSRLTKIKLNSRKQAIEHVKQGES